MHLEERRRPAIGGPMSAPLSRAMPGVTAWTRARLQYYPQDLPIAQVIAATRTLVRRTSTANCVSCVPIRIFRRTGRPRTGKIGQLPTYTHQPGPGQAKR